MRSLLLGSKGLAIATAILLAVAGCVGSAAAGTAKGGEPPAEAEAKRWDSGAQLVKIIGVEGSFPVVGWTGFGSYSGSGNTYASAGSTDLGFEYMSRGKDDRTIGDGRCEVWIYRYVSTGESEAFVVVVDKDGKVLKTGTDEKRDDDRTVGEWKINSDQALQIAKDASPHLRRGVESQSFALFEGLHRDDAQQHAAWYVAGGGGDASGGGGGFVKIDAVTGRVLETAGGSGGSSYP